MVFLSFSISSFLSWAVAAAAPIKVIKAAFFSNEKFILIPYSIGSAANFNNVRQSASLM